MLFLFTDHDLLLVIPPVLWYIESREGEIMNVLEALKAAMQEYREITGLRSYLILDTEEIQSASERNYFCKCLKSSSAALKKCDVFMLQS